jgi:hypothetical protein
MTLKILTAAFVLALAVAPQISYAANGGKPYTNVNHQNDAGNDTGDSQVDKLNDMQLNKNYKGPTYMQGQAPVMQSGPILQK